ncbi:MAG: ATP-binding cassette domain-containing protein [Candidatus Altiarchaeota archaeon]|nr:ATP-binding cassette domain-containing protein [Candidatus Altiarchaeota archaeon]
MDTIAIKDLTKTFNGFTAVDHITFSVEEGELFGLLGPNGAGKTTTLNMLSTLLKPSSGKADIAGADIYKERDAVRRKIGMVFQEPALDTKLTGRENLEFHAMMYGMNKEERIGRIDEVLEVVELRDKENILVENYSGGMKRRLEIARGLMHRPKVLFLDEPTLGLDAQTRRHIWEYIQRLNKENNVTIILTTHYMEEADYLCDRVAIVDHGRIVIMDTPDRLKDLLGGDVISLEVEGDIDSFMESLKKHDWIKTLKKYDTETCQHLGIGENSICLTVEKGDKRIPELISEAQNMDYKIVSVNLHKPSLEDVFLHFTGKRIRETGDNKNETRRDMMRRRMQG